MSDKQIVVKFIGDTKSFDDGTKKVIGGADKIKVSFKDLALGGMAAGAGAQIASAGLGLVSSAADTAIEFIKGSVEASSNLRESMSLSQQVFETNSGVIEAWGRTASDTMGTSARNALDMASGFGTAFKNVGLSLDEATAKSTELSERAVDLGSAFNTSSEEAAESLRSGLLGESEPMRKFGVFLDETKTKAWMLANGMKPVNGVFTDAQKVTARYNQILEQTSDSAGMFGRDANSLADAQKKANARLEDAQALIGDKLLPVMTTLTEYVAGPGVDAILGMVDAVDALATAYGGLRTTADDLDLGEVFQSFPETLGGLGEAIQHEIDLFRLMTDNVNMTREGLQTFRDSERESLGVDWADPLKHTADNIDGVGDAANAAANPTKTLIDEIKKGVDPTRDLTDALSDYFDEMVSNAYAPGDLRVQLADVNAEMGTQRDRLKVLNGMKHRTPEQEKELRDLKGDLRDNQEEVDKLTLDIAVLDGASLSDLKKGFDTLTRLHIDPASAAAQELIRRLRVAEDDARVTKNLVNAALNADKGSQPDHKAGGGAARGLTWVGEDGPELLNLPGGSYVYSNPQSMGMVTAGSGGGGSRAGVVNININGAQDVPSLMQALKRELARTGMSFA